MRACRCRRRALAKEGRGAAACCRDRASLALRYLNPCCWLRGMWCRGPEPPVCSAPWRWSLQGFWDVSENHLCKRDEINTILSGLQKSQWFYGQFAEESLLTSRIVGACYNSGEYRAGDLCFLSLMTQDKLLAFSTKGLLDTCLLSYSIFTSYRVRLRFPLLSCEICPLYSRQHHWDKTPLWLF